ncbi:MAG: hypothetical protein M1828_004481 [Chrysothrix sp. TS-e1954]|nr:MAG: hypothetical protein M1828_004481 [Chrysothrix sp. TS-e1954]
MFESRRRSLLQALNSKYIYGRVPLLHTLVFLLEMAAVSLLVQKFNIAYARRPLLTTMITNAILGGVADTTAQTLTSFRRRQALRHASQMEVFDLDRKSPIDTPLDQSTRDLPPPFDFERMTRFMSFGFLWAVIQYQWYGFLSRSFPITKGGAATMSALKRVAFDQFIAAPVGLALFFTFMTVAEGGGRRAVGRKFQDVFLPALKANYILWPAIQIVNFRLMPLQFQIPLVSSIGIAWTAYLSLTNAADEE